MNRHRPSVDVLFNSCSTTVGSNAIGIIATSARWRCCWGPEAFLAMRNAGARTLAQDEATPVVFGALQERQSRWAASSACCHWGQLAGAAVGPDPLTSASPGVVRAQRGVSRCMTMPMENS